MKRREVLGALVGAALSVPLLGLIGVAVKDEADRLPGSYDEQIYKALGAGGLSPHNLHVNVPSGSFSFNTGPKADEEACQGSFGSNDGVHAVINPVISCTLTNENNIVIQTVAS